MNDFYCQSKNDGKYYLIKREYLKNNGICKLWFTECELKFMAVDVVARDPDHSKEYDRFNVYELKPLKKSKPIKVSKGLIGDFKLWEDTDDDLPVEKWIYDLCNEYVYVKINE